MDAYQLAETQQADGFRGIADERHRIVTEGVIDPIFRGEGTFPDHIFPIRPDQVDRRVILQRACFTFHVPNRPVLTNAANRTLRRYRIRKAAKDAIRNELFLLGIDEFEVYGNLEALAQRLKRAYRITVDPQG